MQVIGGRCGGSWEKQELISILAQLTLFVLPWIVIQPVSPCTAFPKAP